eukprot:m.22388 g.22388  ORF g.22388 m.22388 type:complete len:1352 (+) comp28341_c0_seq2:42-4097(+)
MYFPLGFPKILNDGEEGKGRLICIRVSRDRSFFAVVHERGLSVWYYNPHVSLVNYIRKEEAIKEDGHNVDAAWKPDGSMLALVTTKSRVMFYKLQLTEREIFVSKPVKGAKITENTPAIDGIPEVTLEQTCIVPLFGGISCVASRREELVVATGNGLLCRVRWDGLVDGQLSMQVQAIPFTTDPQRVRAVPLSGSPGLYLAALEYCPKLGGYAFVLSDGRGGLLTSNSSVFDAGNVKGIWAKGVSNANCLAVNQRLGLIAFGCESGEVVLFALDELTGSLLLSHTMLLSPQQYPDAFVRSGPVHCMAWSPDGHALFVGWCRGGYAVWSAFGALLICSLSSDFGLLTSAVDFSQAIVAKSVCWGAEGYHLLLACDLTQDQQDGSADKGDIVVLQFAKSALAANPTLSNCEHVLLHAEDRIFFHTKDSIVKSNAGENGDLSLSTANSKQWIIVQIPLDYLQKNWPIRYAAVDSSGRYVVVSGRRGFAHCTISNRKWKLFGNENHESKMICRGGIVWWKDIIILGCHNMEEEEEVRMYCRSSKLDNSLMSHLIKLSSPVAMVNVFCDCLLVLTNDKRVYLYAMERQESQQGPVVILAKLHEISLALCVPHISSLISLAPSALRTEAVRGSLPAKGLPESLIANVSGKLFLLQRDHAVVDKRGKTGPYGPPVMLASSVENVWSPSQSKVTHRYLLESLWLGCGAGGIKVWLPLFPKEVGSQSGFLSKRIMLTFSLDIYPLLVLFEEAVAMGVACDASTAQRGQLLPFCAIERTAQIFLHHILKQLLRRNLGVHALQIAQSCQPLPYFGHILELMLHNVLEDEALSSVVYPLPDALLPKVVPFIQEFPQYLETIGHCTRKTEVAMWQYLFNVVGNPKDLFQKCLAMNKLETAATYLIIIQNLEPPTVSRQYATRLLDSSLENCMWELCKDLVRFLRAIGSGDVVDSPSRSGPVMPLSAPPFPVADRFEVALEKEIERTGSQTSVVGLRGDYLDESGNFIRRPLFLADLDSTKEEFFIDMILCRHARKLLQGWQLRKLGKFAATLDFPLVTWLNKERNRVAQVDGFPLALTGLHKLMEWPLPICQIPVGSFRSVDASSQASSGSNRSEFLSRTAGTSTAGAGQGSPAPQVVAPVVLEERVQPSPQVGNFGCDSVSDDGESRDPEESSLWDVDDLDISMQPPTIKGPKKSELELRYFLEIFGDARCYEWGLLLAVLLQNVASAQSTVQAVFEDTEMSVDNKSRLLNGVADLTNWARSECAGYVWILESLREVCQLLSSLVATSQMKRESEDEEDGGERPSPKLQRSKSDSAPLGGSQHDSSEATNRPLVVPLSPSRQFPLVAPDTDADDSNQQSCVVS